MSKQFSVKFTGDAEATVAKFKTVASKNGVSLEGDHCAGQFNGMGLEGRYVIDGDELTIAIEKKPLFLSWSMIESKVKGFFGA